MNRIFRGARMRQNRYLCPSAFVVPKSSGAQTLTSSSKRWRLELSREFVNKVPGANVQRSKTSDLRGRAGSGAAQRNVTAFVPMNLVPRIVTIEFTVPTQGVKAMIAGRRRADLGSK